MTLLAVAVRREVPVDPDAETARRWLEEELARAEYGTGSESLLSRLLTWLDSLSFSGPAVSVPLALLITVGVVIVLVAAWLLGGRIRLGARASAAGTAVLGSDARSAEEIRAASADAAQNGHWSAATADRFRAIARSLEERAILDDRPGRTAQELVREASPALPGLDRQLSLGARRFDDVVYGHDITTAEDYAAMASLDDLVQQTRPAHNDSVVGSDR